MRDKAQGERYMFVDARSTNNFSMTPTDEEIILQVQGGDRNKYVVLFDRYYARVESYARRQIHHAETARDIASETFLRAFRNVDSFRVGENISYLGYLLFICRRLVLTERARQHTNPIYSLEDSPGEVERLTDIAELPLAQLLEEERHAMIQEAMRCLPEADREIIHLAFERDLSRRDIVTIMDKPSVSAVTSHLYRAMQKLKSIVVRQGYFAGEYETTRK